MLNDLEAREERYLVCGVVLKINKEYLDHASSGTHNLLRPPKPSDNRRRQAAMYLPLKRVPQYTTSEGEEEGAARYKRAKLGNR